jgi:ribosome-associated protein
VVSFFLLITDNIFSEAIVVNKIFVFILATAYDAIEKAAGALQLAVSMAAFDAKIAFSRWMKAYPASFIFAHPVWSPMGSNARCSSRMLKWSQDTISENWWWKDKAWHFDHSQNDTRKYQGSILKTFTIESGDYIELHDLLKVIGLCSTGGAAKIAIAEGHVNVDGAVEQRKRCKIRKGQTVEYQSRKILIR